MKNTSVLMPVCIRLQYNINIFREVFEVRTSSDFSTAILKSKEISHFNFPIFDCDLCPSHSFNPAEIPCTYYKLLLSHKSPKKKYSNYLLRFLQLQFMYNCVEKGNFSVSL